MSTSPSAEAIPSSEALQVLLDGVLIKTALEEFRAVGEL